MIKPIEPLPQQTLQHRNPPDWWAAARIQFSTILGAEVRNLVPHFDDRFFKEWGFRWQFLSREQQADIVRHPLGNEARRYCNRVIFELTRPTPWQETRKVVERQCTAAAIAIGAVLAIAGLALGYAVWGWVML